MRPTTPHERAPLSDASRTLLEILRLSTSYLGTHGSGTPRLDAELLCADALQLRRIDLYLRFDQPLSPVDVAAIRERVRRRGSGEPVAYITGRREFYGRPFLVSPAVLIPRPDTETLVEAALRLLPPPPADVTVWDLGTGSGCIGITLALERPDIEAVCTDISEDALRIARQNADALDAASRVRFVHGSWADPLAGTPALVASNPPYVTSEELRKAEREVRDHEPALALDAGAHGLGPYRELLASLARCDVGGVTLLLEVDPRRAAAVIGAVRDTFPDAVVSEMADLTGRTRVLGCTLVAAATPAP